MSSAKLPRTACVPITPQTVQRLLESGRFELTTEGRTQADIDVVFAATFGPSGYSREERLGPGDRPDFMVGGAIAVEVKQNRASSRAVIRQLTRYAGYEAVEAIVLATGRAMNVPLAINGKPILVVNLGRAWL